MKTNPEEARYLAELILSIIGVVILLALALYLINKSRKKDEVKPEVKQVLQPKAHKLIEPFTSSTRNPLNATEKSKIKISLSDAFLNWQKEHILTSEDGKSLFVREGVEKAACAISCSPQRKPRQWRCWLPPYLPTLTPKPVIKPKRFREPFGAPRLWRTESEQLEIHARPTAFSQAWNESTGWGLGIDRLVNCPQMLARPGSL